MHGWINARRLVAVASLTLVSLLAGCGDDKTTESGATDVTTGDTSGDETTTTGDGGSSSAAFDPDEFCQSIDLSRLEGTGGVGSPSFFLSQFDGTVGTRCEYDVPGLPSGDLNIFVNGGTPEEREALHDNVLERRDFDYEGASGFLLSAAIFNALGEDNPDDVRITCAVAHTLNGDDVTYDVHFDADQVANPGHDSVAISVEDAFTLCELTLQAIVDSTS